ncbi:hypothetical protein GCM10010326_14160 [Streptomyces xanthochromogenes]|uniref:Amidase n=1 Tax=Streptomyces xanthochromogenes TaxID=67384 RepID=A0ABQ2ZQA0_9ACTN|nr:hypothetical protein GCM10010326_14160 [Streptomyces xanthochromogenes]
MGGLSGGCAPGPPGSAADRAWPTAQFPAPLAVPVPVGVFGLPPAPLAVPALGHLQPVMGVPLALKALGEFEDERP